MQRHDDQKASGLFLGSDPVDGDIFERKAMGDKDGGKDLGGHGPKDTGDADGSDKGDADGSDKGDGGADSRDADGKD